MVPKGKKGSIRASGGKIVPGKKEQSVIKIRCSPQTFWEWRDFASQFYDYEEAISYLLRRARELGLRKGAYL